MLELVFVPDGNLYVASRSSGEVLRYDGGTGAPIGVFVPNGTNSPLKNSVLLRVSEIHYVAVSYQLSAISYEK